MMQGYFNNAAYTNTGDRVCVFDMFFRENPHGNGYSIFAGLEQLIEYVTNLRFGEEELAYLDSLGLFTEDFLKYLKTFRFTGDIMSMREGSVMFPYEPIVRVTAPLMEAQVIESALLNIINHQSLIATKAARVCAAAEGQPVMEFGLRRALGPDSATLGARAAVIGGCIGTSNVLTGKMFDVPVKGTHAHSWIMSFPDELTAFRAYAESFPKDIILLVDTYDTLKSGVPNAITVFNEMLDSGNPPNTMGIRLDSGDLAFLSKSARKMLDDAGLQKVAIAASNDLDENLIQSLKIQGAEITVWGVGTHLITSRGQSSFGGVYKLAAESRGGGFVPKIKVSDNPAKITTPGVKKLYRIIDKETNKIKADYITLDHEMPDMSNDLEIFDPQNTWKRMTLEAGRYDAVPMLVPVVQSGKCVYASPPVMQMRAFCAEQKTMLWDEYTRLTNPAKMPVDLSDELYALKQKMLHDARNV